MKLTKLEEQGLRLTMCLARKDGQMTLPEFAKLEGISEALVAKVLGKLKRGGVVNALRGRNGGYELARSANMLTISDVISALGRPLIEGCFTENKGCRHSSDCGIRPIWQFLSNKVSQVLNQVSLADLTQEEITVRTQLNAIEVAAAKKSLDAGKEVNNNE